MFSSGRSVIRNRFTKYIKTASLDDVHNQVLKEKNKSKTRKSKGLLLASKKLSNYLAMSGLRLSATEFIYIWALTTSVTMLAVLLFHGHIITAVGIVLISFPFLPIFCIVRGKNGRRNSQSSWVTP